MGEKQKQKQKQKKMQLSPNQLQSHLQKGLKSLYTLHGDEPLLIQEAADAIRAAARSQGFAERSSHTVSGARFDWSAVLAAGGSMSLFSEKQLLELRIPCLLYTSPSPRD